MKIFIIPIFIGVIIIFSGCNCNEDYIQKLKGPFDFDEGFRMGVVRVSYMGPSAFKTFQEFALGEPERYLLRRKSPLENYDDIYLIVDSVYYELMLNYPKGFKTSKKILGKLIEKKQVGPAK